MAGVKVKLLVSRAGHKDGRLFHQMEGDIITVSKAEADRMIAKHQCVIVEAPKAKRTRRKKAS